MNLSCPSQSPCPGAPGSAASHHLCRKKTMGNCRRQEGPGQHVGERGRGSVATQGQRLGGILGVLGFWEEAETEKGT